MVWQMRTLVKALVWAFSSVSAFSQPVADPVAAHFRDYRAAIERKDFAAAETAATAAFDASEAANGSRTAVLALNLATLRLTLAEPGRALEPAKRAHALAANGSDTGVDVLLANLTLGRAELAANHATGAERLTDAIEEAETRKEFLAEAYTAAIALGDWTITRGAYDSAREAWVAAARLAPAGSSDPILARGRARLNEGAAILLSGVNRPRIPSARNSPTVAASSAAHEADAALSDAQNLLRPYAFPTETRATLAAGQVLYAQAMAWQGALRARLQSQDEKLREEIAMEGDPPQLPGRALPCSYSTIADNLGYPPIAANTLGAGSVVLHTRFDDEGNAVRREIAAGVPPGAFVEAVRRSMSEWQSERTSDSPPNCDPSGSRYTVFRFVIN
jgi:hypothetical protein